MNNVVNNCVHVWIVAMLVAKQIVKINGRYLVSWAKNVKYIER